MCAQRSGSEPNSEALEGFGVAVVREEGRWRCSALSAKALTSLKAAETELRELRSVGAVFGLLDVDDEFFVIIRPAPSGTRVFISDATAGLDYDLAGDVLDKLNVELPDEDSEEWEELDPWEEGDLGLLADLGLPEAVLGVIVSESDLYPDEQLGMVASRMGFADELSALLDTLSR
ncbi:MAG: tRNA adenosine deaminase-associated protein [Mycobacteriaceae bacterium]